MLLTASVAGCFVLTFRAIARASRLESTSLSGSVEGTLDRTDGSAPLTEFVVRGTLVVAEGMDEGKARRLIEKAEEGCLITNSLIGPTKLEMGIRQWNKWRTTARRLRRIDAQAGALIRNVIY